MNSTKGEWKIEFNNSRVYSVKSRTACICIVLITLIAFIAPISVILILYSADPCFVLGIEGNIRWILRALTQLNDTMHQKLLQDIHLHFIFTSNCTKGWVCAMHKMTVSVDGKITSNLCESMNDEFNTMSLINSINAERRRVGQPSISASDDMCATALIKGLVQKVSTSRNHH